MKDSIRAIGLVGPSKAGKTTVGKMFEVILCDEVAVTSSFSAHIRSLAKSKHGWDGKMDDEGRALLRKVGAAGRELDPDHWLTKTKETAAYQWSLYAMAGEDVTYVLFDDVRFPNEAAYIKDQLGGCLVRMNAPFEPSVEYEVETAQTYIDCDFEIHNKHDGLNRLMLEATVVWVQIKKWFDEKEKAKGQQDKQPGDYDGFCYA